MSEPFYSGEWASEMENWYPADDDNDNRIREGIYAPGDNNPADHPPTYDEDPSFYDDDPVETDDPYDMRGWD